MEFITKDKRSGTNVNINGHFRLISFSWKRIFYSNMMANNTLRMEDILESINLLHNKYKLHDKKIK